ncbi:hypothetical protein L6R52_14260 [Myxococcota bacterium]|nr:hypothetical protein [Myxococcota bacterium]
MKTLSCLAVAFAGWLASSTALAADVRVAVGDVSGSIGPMVESAIRKSLDEAGVDIVEPGDWTTAMESLDGDELAVAAELGVAIIVEAETKRGKAGWEAVVKARSGATGKVSKSWTAKGKDIKALTAAIDAGLWKSLGPTISKAKPPKPPKKKKLDTAEVPAKGSKKKPKVAEKKVVTPVDEADEDTSAADEEPAEETNVAPAKIEAPATVIEEKPAVAAKVAPSRTFARNAVPLEVAAGVELFARNFSYNDDLFGRLRPYTLSGAPAISVQGVWYPGAHFTHGIAANLGIAFDVELGLALESSDASGATYPTSALEAGGALRWRIPFADASELAISAGGGVQQFSVDPADTGASPELPSVGYGFVRGGVDARIALPAGLAVIAGLGYRQVLSAGEITEDAWFPRASAGGLDGEVGLGYAIIDALEARVTVFGRRYFYSMDPEPGDPNVAGGALDQYFGGSLSIAWMLGR